MADSEVNGGAVAGSGDAADEAAAAEDEQDELEGDAVRKPLMFGRCFHAI